VSTDLSLSFTFTAEGQALGSVRLPVGHLGSRRQLRRDLRTQGLPCSVALGIAGMIAELFGGVPTDMLSDIEGDIRVDLTSVEDEA